MSTARALLLAMRPKQWTKNLVVFAPAIFGEVLLLSGNPARLTALFVLLCAASAAVYLVNDLVDREADRAYERTSSRPLASGALAPRLAAIAAAALAAVSVAGSYALDVATGHIVLAYLLVQLAYTFWLKRVVVLDVLVIALGFILRAVAGAAAVRVPNSMWLLACVALLVLLLAVLKRRQELVELGVAAPRHRAVLGSYTVPLLDVLTAALSAAVSVSYLLYTLLGAGRLVPGMVLTVPFVLYGVFRYMVLSYSEGRASEAEELLLTDAPLILTVVAWLATSFVLIYVV